MNVSYDTTITIIIIIIIIQFFIIYVPNQQPKGQLIIIIIIIIIKCIYLRANLTAQRPITKRARVEKKKHTHTYKQNTKARQF
jgi:hypothetical protein